MGLEGLNNQENKVPSQVEGDPTVPPELNDEAREDLRRVINLAEKRSEFAEAAAKLEAKQMEEGEQEKAA